MKIICKIFDHDWRYNFPSIPNKRICKRCKEKQQLDLLHRKWDKIYTFGEDKRTDKELINKWHR